MEHYKTSIAAFDQQASAYNERFMHVDIYNESYDFFCDQIIKPDADIFEIGCGPGNITRYMLDKKPGFRFLCTDAAPAMLEIAATNNPEVKTELLDCRDIQSQKNHFDAIVCGFCFPYLCKEDCTRVIGHCASILNEGGVFYLSLIEGDYGMSGYEQSSDGRNKAFVYYYKQDFFNNVITDTHLKIIRTWKFPYQKNDGSIQNHLVLVFRKY